MIDFCTDIFRGGPGRFAPMLDDDWDDQPNWTHDEMEAILQHQLNAPLDADLPAYTVRTLSHQHSNRPSNPVTFGDLLRDQQPSLDLLVITKEFAKDHLRLRGKGLPRKVARTLYYASVVAARLCLDQRISRLSDAKLVAGLDWAIRQPWLHPDLLELFRQGREALTTTPATPAPTLTSSRPTHRE